MAPLRLNSPFVQNFLASVIVCLLPGIYYALTTLGAGGGPANAARMANISNTTLYAVYFFVGIFSGSVVTTIGPKYTFLVGSLGYPIFVGSMWYFTNTGHLWYPVFAGAILGVSGSLLWTAAAFVAFSYATEQRKGQYISMQWGLVSAGSTIASLVAFGINYNTSVVAVPNAVYIVFLVLMCCSWFVAWFGIVNPEDVRRADGSPIAHYPHKGFWEELKAQRMIFADWRILVLVIPMFASEIAVIVFSTVNALYFDIRARSLNSVIFVLVQAIGAIGSTLLLDSQKLGTRRTRGMVSTTTMGLLTIATWVGLLVWLIRNPFDPLAPPLFSWNGAPFGGYMALTVFLGINMVIYQVVVQWIVASLTNDPETLARYAGFAKGCLAGGLCATFGTEAAGTLTQVDVTAFCFTFQGVGLICMLIVCWFGVTETNYGLEKDVMVPQETHSETKNDTPDIS